MTVTLHVSRRGPGDEPSDPTGLAEEGGATARRPGPAVLWVHGVDSDHHVWDRCIEQLSHRYECAAVDLPGHGESPRPEAASAYAREAVLDAVNAVIADLRSVSPDRQVIWVGHSLGGYLGMAHVLVHPEHAADPHAIDGLVAVAAGPGFRDPAAMEDWNARVRKNMPGYSVTPAAARIAFHSDSLVMDRLDQLALPMALVVGDGDRAFLGANDYLERKLPQARRFTVEGGRHFVMKSHPEVVAAAVDHVAAALAAPGPAPGNL